jgi:hypothetical protein
MTTLTVKLVRDGAPQGIWLSVEDMLDDIVQHGFEFRAGDKLLVVAAATPWVEHESDIPKAPHLRLV